MLWSDMLWLTQPDSRHDIKQDWPIWKPGIFLGVQQSCLRPCLQNITLLPVLQFPPWALTPTLSFSLKQGWGKCVFVFPKTEVPLFTTPRRCRVWPEDAYDRRSGRDWRLQSDPLKLICKKLLLYIRKICSSFLEKPLCCVYINITQLATEIQVQSPRVVVCNSQPLNSKPPLSVPNAWFMGRLMLFQGAVK